MAITKEKKQQIIAKLQKIVEDAKSLVFVNFHGLPVAQATLLRNKLREKQIGYVVAKKTLIKKVLEQAKIKGQIPSLEGEIGIAYGEDLMSPAKEVYEFHKATNLLEIVGGTFQAEYLDKPAMLAIAQIPSREILYGKLANIINWPIRGLVIVLDQISATKKS